MFDEGKKKFESNDYAGEIFLAVLHFDTKYEKDEEFWWMCYFAQSPPIRCINKAEEFIKRFPASKYTSKVYKKWAEGLYETESFDKSKELYEELVSKYHETEEGKEAETKSKNWVKKVTRLISPTEDWKNTNVYLKKGEIFNMQFNGCVEYLNFYCGKWLSYEPKDKIIHLEIENDKEGLKYYDGRFSNPDESEWTIGELERKVVCTSNEDGYLWFKLETGWPQNRGSYIATIEW